MEVFADAGIAVRQRDDLHLIFRASPIGALSGGHSHADALSLVVRKGDRDILFDPGTYNYVDDLEARAWFRGTAAHNTVRIDGLDQAEPVNPFRWGARPQVRLLSATDDRLEAECRYRDITHRREVLIESDRLRVRDHVTGHGEHLLEQHWHGDITAIDAPDSEVIPSWRSRAYGHREPAQARRRTVRGPLPTTLESVVRLD